MIQNTCLILTDSKVKRERERERGKSSLPWMMNNMPRNKDKIFIAIGIWMLLCTIKISYEVNRNIRLHIKETYCQNNIKTN